MSENEKEVIEVTSEYDQFIGIYPNVVPVEVCDTIIDYAEHLQESGLLLDRKNYDHGNLKIHKNDYSCDVGLYPQLVKDYIPEEQYSFILTEADPCIQTINRYLVPCLESYTEKYDTLKPEPLMSLYHKVQKTDIGGGYHVWHSEHGNNAYCNRVLAYTLYLNDVEEGGETEFLYQSKRIPAKKGHICIFPASFTHIHRGNPPISNEKYIMTGWVQYANFSA